MELNHQDREKDDNRLYPPQQIISELPEKEKVKLEVIQTLLEPCDRTIYGERLREGAKKLGISVRSVQRLFKAC